MNSNKNVKTGVAGNFLQRTNADMLRVMTTTLRNKIADERLFDVSILKVDTAPDLSSAKVFVTGGAKELAGCVHIFKNDIAQNMRIKRVPNLKFLIDNGDDNTLRVEELLKQIKSEGGHEGGI